MITETEISTPTVVVQLHALCHAAYALEAKWIDASQFPPLSESLLELQQSADRLLIYAEAGVIFGALTFATTANCLNVTRLVVDPARFRTGIATALLNYLVERIACGSRVTVSTAEANLPAVLLYQRLGFETIAFSNTREGIRLIQLAKSP